MTTKPKTKGKAKAKKPRAPRKTKAKAAPVPALTGGPKASTRELSALLATISAMDEAVNAHGSIPPQRQDSELRGVLDDFSHIRPTVMERLERIKRRSQEE